MEAGCFQMSADGCLAGRGAASVVLRPPGCSVFGAVGTADLSRYTVVPPLSWLYPRTESSASGRAGALTADYWSAVCSCRFDCCLSPPVSSGRLGLLTCLQATSHRPASATERLNPRVSVVIRWPFVLVAVTTSSVQSAPVRPQLLAAPH